ncbi:MAG: tyrosine-type recombinase/integrase [Methylobacterium sp.]|uniref:tyrosine-type recombinase/integrase n=1 Tax=Methylobacterium sp. TaxID=409 RepID=UPI002583B590|nr:tyrosine-type recombinase/integrase [Methylobacterium sp.]MBY0296697.1 tyrosine-type recombinase/integrase [Methylobacterium sp.]
MTRLRLKYIHAFTDRHGKSRYYFRRHGKRIRLPGLPGSAEFMAAYAAAAAEKTEPPAARRPIESGSIADLVARYYASTAFLRLKPITRRNYRGVLDRFCALHGHRAVAGLTRERVSRIIAGMADRPGAATVLLKRLKTLAAFGVEIGVLESDPTHRVRAFASAEVHTWTEPEIARFEAQWPIGSKQRLAFALHLYTGQRRSDVHRMTWGDYDGDIVRLIQQKTGAALAIPVHPRLAAILDVTPRTGSAILLTEHGRPFTVAGYGNWMAAAISRAGLPDRCVLHGLRKSAARRLAEAGCTAHEIAAITGHKSLSEVERYTRAADQVRLARAAVRKQALANPTPEIGKPAEKPNLIRE